MLTVAFFLWQLTSLASGSLAVVLQIFCSCFLGSDNQCVCACVFFYFILSEMTVTSKWDELGCHRGISSRLPTLSFFFFFLAFRLENKTSESLNTHVHLPELRQDDVWCESVFYCQCLMSLIESHKGSAVRNAL